MKRPPGPERLIVVDDESTLARFNDEKNWIKFELTRPIPGARMREINTIFGLMVGVHSDWVYRRFEGACDGVVDFKLEERDGRTTSVMRIRNIRNVTFDSRWHQLKISENFEITRVVMHR